MPTAPKRRLLHPAHKREPRPHACARGYTRKWQEYSKSYLAIHTRCAGVLIQGKRVHAANCRGASECVDHVQAVAKDDERFWLESNHQPLSLACNSLKRQKIDHVA